jgi:dTDP-4-dehydrorhamnose 3,5-epimerase
MAMTEMSARPTEIDGLLVIAAKAAEDGRGTVREIYRQSAFGRADVPAFGPPQQVNLTETRRGAIRGLHGEEMTKLVGVATGEGFGAYVDLRPRSATFGAVVTVELHPGRQVLVPRGVCNGFQSVSTGCTYLYCFDAEWTAGMAGSAVHPLDTDLAISWPIRVDPSDRALLSARDAGLPSLAELRAGLRLPQANGPDEPEVVK